MKQKTSNISFFKMRLLALISSLLILVPAIAETTASNSAGLNEQVSSTTVILASDSSCAIELSSSGNELASQSTEPSKQIRITAVGDIMMHQRQLDTHFDKAAGKYVFDDDYIHISDELTKADLLIGNLETTLGGPNKKYSGYPLFNTPDSLAEALKRAGFDVLSAANNHALDTGADGLKRTARVLKELGFGVIGTRDVPEAKSSIIREIKGIKIGMLGYTYETGRSKKGRTLNGNPMPANVLPFIDTFSPSHIDEAVKEISERVYALKKEGAELIIIYLHWGVEYGTIPTAWQKQMAQKLADSGVDIIFGSHPHVVQTATYVQRADGGKTFVAWSMGNFISNQRFEFLNRHNTEDGLMISLNIEKTTTEKIQISRIEYHPLWVHRHNRNNQWHYHIVPLPKALLNPEVYQFNRENLIRARNSLIRTQSVLKDAPEWQTITVPELSQKSGK